MQSTQDAKFILVRRSLIKYTTLVTIVIEARCKHLISGTIFEAVCVFVL